MGLYFSLVRFLELLVGSFFIFPFSTILLVGRFLLLNTSDLTGELDQDHGDAGIL